MPLPSDEPPQPQQPLTLRVEPPRPTFQERLKKLFGPVGTVLVLIFSLFGKLKFLILPVLKFFPLILKTGGTMILSIGVYAMNWGWWFALGFVLLIFVHECGHLVLAKRFGLKVGAPVFIPFMGAFIALKEAPRNAWIEAWVGIGGPLFGAAGAALCAVGGVAFNEPLLMALAYSGFFLNLFNLMPVGFLDGGRIATAISPWLWVIGLVIATAMAIQHVNVILILIIVAALPRVWSLFRTKTEEEKRYFEVTPTQRATIAILYFGLIALLVAGMTFTHIAPHRL